MNRVDTRESRIDTLKKIQESRKQDCLGRVYKAIERLQKTGAKINFHTVAKEANLSVSYLYKYPELKQQVAQIRSQQSSMPVSPIAKPASSSHAKVVSRLKERIQGLEAQNQELRRKNEALAGQVYRVHYLQEQAERQQQTIKALEERIRGCEPHKITQPETPFLSSPKVTSLDNKRLPKSGASEKIQSELEKLGIRVNSTLSKLINSAPEEVVLKAINTLKEALTATKVHNSSGFLVEAIRNTWMPNEGYDKKIELDDFIQWYDLAKEQKLIIASMKGDDGKIYVFTPDGVQVLFEQMLAKYPLETLKLRS